MPDVVLPHEFEDNVDQVASGQQVMDNLNAILAVLNGALDSGNVPDLAVLGTYRRLAGFTAQDGSVFATGGANIWIPAIDGTFEDDFSSNFPQEVFYLAAADYAVTGKTTKCRIRAQILTDATAPGITFTFGLYPITGSSGASATATLGAVVAGSTVAIASPAANDDHHGASGDFDIPADGLYTFGVATSGTPAGGASEILSAQLQLRHV